MRRFRRWQLENLMVGPLQDPYPKDEINGPYLSVTSIILCVMLVVIFREAILANQLLRTLIIVITSGVVFSIGLVASLKLREQEMSKNRK